MSTLRVDDHDRRLVQALQLGHFGGDQQPPQRRGRAAQGDFLNSDAPPPPPPTSLTPSLLPICPCNPHRSLLLLLPHPPSPCLPPRFPPAPRPPARRRRASPRRAPDRPRREDTVSPAHTCAHMQTHANEPLHARSCSELPAACVCEDSLLTHARTMTLRRAVRRVVAACAAASLLPSFPFPSPVKQIVEAIKTLKVRGGASRQAITSYIEANHDGKVRAHGTRRSAGGRAAAGGRLPAHWSPLPPAPRTPLARVIVARTHPPHPMQQLALHTSTSLTGVHAPVSHLGLPPLVQIQKGVIARALKKGQSNRR